MYPGHWGEVAPEHPALVMAESGEMVNYAGSTPYKCPQSVDFVDQLPRLPTGKLYKLELRERYWTGEGSRVIGV